MLEGIKSFLSKLFKPEEVCSLKEYELEDLQRIVESKYFDEEYYLSQNPDVKSAGVDPAYHYYVYGWKEKRNPSRDFDTERILTEYPEISKDLINPIIYILDNNLQETIKHKKIEKKISASELINSYFGISAPLNAMPIDTVKSRINIVFNGFDKSCFFGGKATALILAIMFAQKYHYGLRIIAQKPDKEVFYDVLKLFNLEYKGELEFYSTEENSGYLEVGEKDHFICTMWSNADAVLNTSSISGKIFYIMQEVETFFYDHGDFHLRCFNTLTNNRLIPIVNTKLLYDYLVEHDYNNVKQRGIYFEPAFLKKLYSPSEQSFIKKDKYKLFFYGRPTHQRNLFYFGLSIINKAFLRGVLNKKEWSVYIAGDEEIPDFRFDSGVKVKKMGVMDWNEYSKLASSIDLCYSTIYTPHPSYPPFDFACSGAIVVTNKFQNKHDLYQYSNNILSAELDEEALINRLSDGVKLVKDIKTRKRNFEQAKIKTVWEDSFIEVLPFMKNNIEK